MYHALNRFAATFVSISIGRTPRETYDPFPVEWGKAGRRSLALRNIQSMDRENTTPHVPEPETLTHTR